MTYDLTPANVDAQVSDLRARVGTLTRGLDDAGFNWQPRGGRQWSIAQNLDHLVRTTDLYVRALEAAIDEAPPVPPGPPARPNLLGRVFIWAIEPPVRVRVPARGDLKPPSHHALETLLPGFSESLERVSALAARAATVDAGRLRYANPLAGGARTFTVVTGVMVILAHDRRHLTQAEKVRLEQARQARPV